MEVVGVVPPSVVRMVHVVMMIVVTVVVNQPHYARCVVTVVANDEYCCGGY